MSLSRIFYVIAFLLEFSAILSFPITQSVLKNLNLLTESCFFLRSRFFFISSLHHFVYNEDKCFLCVCTFWTKIQNEYSNAIFIWEKLLKKVATKKIHQMNCWLKIRKSHQKIKIDERRSTTIFQKNKQNVVTSYCIWLKPIKRYIDILNSMHRLTVK